MRQTTVDDEIRNTGDDKKMNKDRRDEGLAQKTRFTKQSAQSEEIAK